MEMLFMFFFPIEFMVLWLGTSAFLIFGFSWKILPYTYNQGYMFFHNYSQYLMEINKFKKVQEIVGAFSKVSYPIHGGFPSAGSNFSYIDLIIKYPSLHLYSLITASIAVILFYGFSIWTLFKVFKYIKTKNINPNL